MVGVASSGLPARNLRNWRRANCRSIGSVTSSRLDKLHAPLGAIFNAEALVLFRPGRTGDPPDFATAKDLEWPCWSGTGRVLLNLLTTQARRQLSRAKVRDCVKLALLVPQSIVRGLRIEIRQRVDLVLAQLRCDAAHSCVDVVAPGATFEGAQLACQVFIALTRQGRCLDRPAGI